MSTKDPDSIVFIINPIDAQQIDKNSMLLIGLGHQKCSVKDLFFFFLFAPFLLMGFGLGRLLSGKLRIRLVAHSSQCVCVYVACKQKALVCQLRT